jgi:hypothetical protein
MVQRTRLNMGWKFSDPPNVAIFTTRGVVESGNWIAHVSHDEDDGTWQFHDNTTDPTEANALLSGLGEIVGIDASVETLADLPLGWRAWRASKGSPWQRLRNSA